jgi:hypothetical protein
MKKTRTIPAKRVKKNLYHDEPIAWLPFDSRILGPFEGLFMGFRHVTGIAKIFLEFELIITSVVVLGTLALVVIHTLPK